MAENKWVTGEISASKWIRGTLLKNPVGGPPWRNLQVPNPELQSQISHATGVFIFMNNFNSWMNVGKTWQTYYDLWSSHFRALFDPLYVCILSWFAFFHPRLPKTHTKRISHNGIKNAGHHLSYRFVDRVAKNLRGNNSMEWCWLLQHQSAPRSRSVEMEWLISPL